MEQEKKKNKEESEASTFASEEVESPDPLEEEGEEQSKSVDDDFAQFGPIKKPILKDMDSSLNIGQPYHQKKSGKKTTIFLIILLVVVLGAIFFTFKGKGSVKKMVSATPTPGPTFTPAPTETPKKTLDRSEWSLEVLNGSGATGLAKKIADKVKDLGYPLVKVGNADKDSYPKTQILVKKDLIEKVNLVIADLKDILKIASFGGELKDSTASARVIIGKDSI